MAYDTETGQNVILKQVFDKAEFEHERDMLDELSRLDIPYVIRLQDIVPPSLHSKQALVFPQLSKFQSLSIHNLVDVARWMRQLMTALAKLHRNGIAHLDISSSNIMLLASDHKNNNCKTNTTTTILSTTTTAAAEEHEFDDKRPSLVLIDFGLSRLFSGRPTDCHPQGRGTCGYVAPEMLSGDAHTGSPDIYSAGVILGQFLQPYISDPSLAYLGSKLVRPSTTTHISMRLRELFDDQFYETTTSPLMIRMSSSPATALAGFNGGPHHNTNGTPIWKSMVRKAADLLAKMLEPDASTRITAAAALAHPFLMASEKDGDFEGTDLEAYSKFLQTNSYSAMYPSRKQSYIVRYR